MKEPGLGISQAKITEEVIIESGKVRIEGIQTFQIYYDKSDKNFGVINTNYAKSDKQFKIEIILIILDFKDESTHCFVLQMSVVLLYNLVLRSNEFKMLLMTKIKL